MTICCFAGLGWAVIMIKKYVFSYDINDGNCVYQMTREGLVAHLTEVRNLADHLEMIAKHLKTLGMSGRVEKDEVEKDGVPNNKALTRGALGSSGAVAGNAIPN